MRRKSTSEDWKALKEKLLELLEALPEEKARTERTPNQKN